MKPIEVAYLLLTTAIFDLMVHQYAAEYASAVLAGIVPSPFGGES